VHPGVIPNREDHEEAQPQTPSTGSCWLTEGKGNRCV
jgi:hypothetical protein